MSLWPFSLDTCQNIPASLKQTPRPGLKSHHFIQTNSSVLAGRTAALVLLHTTNCFVFDRRRIHSHTFVQVNTSDRNGLCFTASASNIWFLLIMCWDTLSPPATVNFNLMSITWYCKDVYFFAATIWPGSFFVFAKPLMFSKYSKTFFLTPQRRVVIHFTHRLISFVLSLNVDVQRPVR